MTNVVWQKRPAPEVTRAAPASLCGEGAALRAGQRRAAELRELLRVRGGPSFAEGEGLALVYYGSTAGGFLAVDSCLCHRWREDSEPC